ncbi:MAG: hypothetical protein ACR2OI_11955 [Acidimicrobiia bacterium]
MRGALAALVALAMAASACSSGPSLTEYADKMDSIVGTHRAGMEENDAWFESEPETIERVHTYATSRIELRTTFLAELEEATAPREAEDLHVAAISAIRSLVEAETVLFNNAMSASSMSELGNLWTTPAGESAREADEKVIAICQAAEAALNSTEERQALVGVPWVPTELQEVVEVAFGCGN